MKGKKTIIINKDIIDKGILNETIAFNQIPKHIRLSILRNETPLSNNPAFPNDDYIKNILTKTYAGLDNFKNVNISNILGECQKIERPIRNVLEKLCFKKVFELFKIDATAFDFRLDLKDEISCDKNAIQLNPNENPSFNFDDIIHMKNIKKEVDKRLFLNAMIEGVAEMYTEIILRDSMNTLSSYNKDLYNLYIQYLSLNKYLLFASNDKLTQDDKHQTGYAIVTLGNETTKNKLLVEALIFPVLVYETIKGIMQMCIAHGLPENAEDMKYVLSQSDYLIAEPWNMRFGPQIWQDFYNKNIEQSEVETANLLQYVMQRISEIPCNKFNNFMQESLVGTKKAKIINRKLVTWANDKLSHSEFNSRMQQKNNKANFILINDAFITPNEL